MRLLVFGGRGFDDKTLFYHAIACALNWHSYGEEANESWLPPNGTVVIHGDCSTGADRLADEWAIVHWVPCERYPAEWDKHGRAAGPIRNQVMIDKGKPDAGLGFPGGKGTADMMRRLHTAGIKVYDYTAIKDSQP